MSAEVIPPRAAGEVWLVANTGRHLVSNLGRVWSVHWGRLMGGAPNERGYHVVVLGKVHVKVHRLVLETFVGPCPDGMECLHINGDPGDNRVENLRWGTHAENMQDSLAHGTHRWASSKTCTKGHPYTQSTTYRHNGRRHCRICAREYKANYRLRLLGGAEAMVEAS